MAMPDRAQPRPSDVANDLLAQAARTDPAAPDKDLCPVLLRAGAMIHRQQAEIERLERIVAELHP